MSLRCQPGDLAVIVRARSTESKRYIGQIVEVHAWRPVSPEGRVSTERTDWEIEAVGFTFPDGSSFADCDDEFLKPLRGNPDAITETRDEVSA